MAKLFAIVLLALVAIFMLQIPVMASKGNYGYQLRKGGHGPGSLKSSQCPSQCSRRCGRTQYHKPCMFFCQKCCRKCLCVPPGYYGNKAVCPCYNNWKTKEDGPVNGDDSDGRYGPWLLAKASKRASPRTKNGAQGTPESGRGSGGPRFSGFRFGVLRDNTVESAPNPTTADGGRLVADLGLNGGSFSRGADTEWRKGKGKKTTASGAVSAPVSRLTVGSLRGLLKVPWSQALLGLKVPRRVELIPLYLVDTWLRLTWTYHNIWSPRNGVRFGKFGIGNGRVIFGCTETNQYGR
ncbi:Gibberellin-regulated protein 4 [Striga hermonthica]|uniref:Gibberellin-regulated protein 4 n=1 Tax=Striga hermonthica TaxID=68872 RepID=A0A9N7MVU3_STRHE|nr:Gibberellin-regulated protein 4 [Striga hermonthica]